MTVRFEWLFLRWVAIIGVVALGLRYAWSLRDTDSPTRYQKVVLLQGSSSFGVPVAGIAVDARRREVYGLLGEPGKGVPSDFFILWKGKDGESYAATFAPDTNSMTGVCEILPDGETRTLHRSASATPASGHSADPSETLRSIVHALPPDLNVAGE